MDTLSIIVHLMKKNDCKNKDLAEALGRDAQLVTDWRNKKSSSYRQYLPQIADYFGVTVDYLLGKEDPPASPVDPAASGWDLDEREQTLLTTFRSTTEEGRQLIIQSVLNIRDDIAKRNTNPSQDKAAK